MQDYQFAGFYHVGVGAHPSVVQFDVDSDICIGPLNGGGVYGLRRGRRGCGCGRSARAALRCG